MILVHLQRNWPETGAPADLRGKKWNTTVHFIIICSTNILWISLFCGSRSHQTESISLSLVCHAHRQAAHSFSAMMVFCVRYKAAVCSLLMYISMWFVVVSFGCLSVGYKYVFGLHFTRERFVSCDLLRHYYLLSAALSLVYDRNVCCTEMKTFCFLLLSGVRHFLFFFFQFCWGWWYFFAINSSSSSLGFFLSKTLCAEK